MYSENRISIDLMLWIWFHPRNQQWPFRMEHSEIFRSNSDWIYLECNAALANAQLCNNRTRYVIKFVFHVIYHRRFLFQVAVDDCWECSFIRSFVVKCTYILCGHISHALSIHDICTHSSNYFIDKRQIGSQ